MNKARFAIIAILCLAITSFFLLPASQADTTRTSAKQITFTKDVASIFFKNCAECHRSGEAAPFSVMSYKDVRPWAKSIREKVVNKEMPPWHADPHIQEFKNDRRMTQAEIDAITAWIDGGAPEGDPKDMPPVPEFANGWNIGKPDVVITMPEEFTLEANGPDEIQYFEADPGFKEDKYVMMAEARPGNRQIVHHLIAFIRPPAKDGKPAPKLTPEEIKKMREEFERDSVFYQDGTLTKVKMDAPVYDDGCSLPSGGSGFKRDGSGSDPNQNALLVGFAPGMPVAKWGPGMVKKIPRRIEDHFPDALLEGRKFGPERPFNGRTGLRQRTDGETGHDASGFEQLFQDSGRRRQASRHRLLEDRSGYYPDQRHASYASARQSNGVQSRLPEWEERNGSQRSAL